MKHAHQDIGGAGRVGQRTEDVEDGAHAQFLADGRDIFHGRMVVGREHEADTDLFNAFCNRFGRQVDVDAQRLHYIRTARLAADAAPAVLADLGTGSRSDKHRAGRDVEGVRAVTTGADDVDQVGFVDDVDLG